MDKRAITAERQRQRYYTAARSIMRKALKTYSTEFGKELKKCVTPQQMTALAEKILKPEAIEKAMRKIYIPVGKTFGEHTYNGLIGTKSLKFEPNVTGLVSPSFFGAAQRPAGLTLPTNNDYWFAWADKLINGTLGERIKVITGTTREMFIKTVDKIAYTGFEKGDSIDRISRAIMKELNITEAYRAERIARTEVISAANMSSQAGAQATGLDLEKEWISYIDDKTRDSHIQLNGAKVDVNDTFSNGLEVPGDPAGSAEDVINCRCTVAYTDKSGNYNWGRDI